MITIIDYGVGNIRAFRNVYERLNIPVKVAQNTKDLVDTTRLILPGVGSFDYAMCQFNKSGMRDKVEEMVINKEVPILGICVGMQMLAFNSEEGKLPGLGWIEGVVKQFDSKLIKYKTKLPHMGWNSISIKNENILLRQLDENSKFYFLHSYYFECANSQNKLCETEYGIKYSSAVNKDNIYGVQFHPEKSHSNGVQLLLNFSRV